MAHPQIINQLLDRFYFRAGAGRIDRPVTMRMGVKTVCPNGTDQPSPAMPGSTMGPKQPCKEELDQLPLRHASLSVVQQPGTSR